MSSNNQISNVEQVTINSDLIQHSEYDIEAADNSDVSFAKDVNKLVFNFKQICICKIGESLIYFL